MTESRPLTLIDWGSVAQSADAQADALESLSRSLAAGPRARIIAYGDWSIATHAASVLHRCGIALRYLPAGGSPLVALTCDLVELLLNGDPPAAVSVAGDEAALAPLLALLRSRDLPVTLLALTVANAEPIAATTSGTIASKPSLTTNGSTSASLRPGATTPPSLRPDAAGRASESGVSLSPVAETEATAGHAPTNDSPSARPIAASEADSGAQGSLASTCDASASTLGAAEQAAQPPHALGESIASTVPATGHRGHASEVFAPPTGRQADAHAPDSASSASATGTTSEPNRRGACASATRDGFESAVPHPHSGDPSPSEGLSAAREGMDVESVRLSTFAEPRRLESGRCEENERDPHTNAAPDSSPHPPTVRLAGAARTDASDDAKAADEPATASRDERENEPEWTPRAVPSLLPRAQNGYRDQLQQNAPGATSLDPKGRRKLREIVTKLELPAGNGFSGEVRRKTIDALCGSTNGINARWRDFTDEVTRELLGLHICLYRHVEERGLDHVTAPRVRETFTRLLQFSQHRYPGPVNGFGQTHAPEGESWLADARAHREKLLARTRSVGRSEIATDASADDAPPALCPSATCARIARELFGLGETQAAITATGCTVCRGASATRATLDLATALRAHRRTRLLIVGGKEAERAGLADRLLPFGIEVRDVNGDQLSPNEKDAAADRAWAEVTVIWTKQLSHRVSAHYSGDETNAVQVWVTRGGITQVAAAVRERLAQVRDCT